MSIITNGYRLPFMQSPPPPVFEKNNASSLRHKQFVEESIKQLQDSGCVKEVFQIPHCVNPLTVAEGKKLRLVLDLRNVNKHLNITKFKYENLSTVAEIINKNDYSMWLSPHTDSFRAPNLPRIFVGFYTRGSCDHKIFHFSCFGIWARNSRVRVYQGHAPAR